MKKRNEPYAELKKWEKIVDIQLLILTIAVILSLIMYLIRGVSMNILWDVVAGVITGLLTSISVSIFTYFKFLKHVPDETKKQIDDLLNSRLGYETTNHNASMAALNPDNAHLSKEHTEMKDIIGREYSNIRLEVKSATDISSAIKDHLVKSDYEKKLQYSNLQIKQKNIIDSIQNISSLGNALQAVNTENIELKEKLTDIEAKYEQLLEKFKGLDKEYNKATAKNRERQRNSQMHDRDIDFER